MSYVQELRALVGTRPVILAGATVIVRDREGRVLLQQRMDDGTWGLPGGAMELGESLDETGRREVWEETGVQVGALRFVGLLSGPEFFHTYPNGDQAYFVSAVYEGEVESGQPQGDGLESRQATFFPLTAFPEMAMDPVSRAAFALIR